MSHLVAWFEIPTLNLERAMAFYETVLGASFDKTEIATGFAMASFRGSEIGTGGALVWGPDFGYEPSNEGALIYITSAEPLGIVLARVEDAGGQVHRDLYSLGDNGFAAVVLDCEGNRIALHGWTP
jgi:predicted enzyme related to lactoylglutathione lyase